MNAQQVGILSSLFLLSAIVSHLALLDFIPRKAMQTVMERTGQSGTRENVLVHAPPVNPASRGVVRPSPDLIYSICVYDLADGPIRLHLAPSRIYASLSLYDGRTNNYYVVNNQAQQERGITVWLSNGSDQGGSASKAMQTIISPTRKGVALFRRIAATPEQLEIAQRTRAGDRCTIATMPS